MSLDEQDVPAIPAGLRLAGFGSRSLGVILDQVIAVVPVAIGAVVAGYRPGEKVSSDAIAVLNGANVLVLFAYQTIMVALCGRTVGKIATGTRVVRSDDGGAPGWFASTQRALVTAVAGGIPEISLLLAGVVYGAAYLSPRRQGVHDRAAGTLVVRAR